MNFYGDGSDAWVSTPAQEIFIQNYFTKREPLNDITKKSRKRKKHLPPSDTASASSSVISNYPEKKTSKEMPKIKNSNKKSKPTSPAGLETSSTKSNTEENENRKKIATNFASKNLEKNFIVLKSSKTESHKIKNFSQKPIVNKTRECKKESQNDANMIDKSSKVDLQNNNSPSKRVNLKKKKSKIGQTSQMLSKPLVAEDNFVVKITKNTSNKKYLNNDDSDDFKNKVIQSKPQNLKKRKLKKKNTPQLLNKPLVSEPNFEAKMLKPTKNNLNIKENYRNTDDSEVPRSELQNKQKQKSQTIKSSQIDESGDSEDEITHNKLQNLKKRKSKASKASQIYDSKDEVTQSKLQKKRKSKTTQYSQVGESDELSRMELQNPKKRKSKTDEVTQSKLQKKRKLKTTQYSQVGESDDSEDELSQKELQNPKKRKSKISKVSQIKNKSPTTKSNFQTKKVKNTKDTSEVKEQCLNVNDSDASEEDEVIRGELQNTRMFLKIQKLMKLAPHLNPNFVKDSTDEMNNSSCDEISTENSSSGSDGECSSEDDNEVSKDNNKDLSGDSSEDSLNSKEEDSSESEEDDIGSQVLHQTASKQEIPAQQLETYSQKKSNLKKPNSLMEKARAKLAAAKFRLLNEKLYTESGGEAFRYFQENKEEFEDYHLGYGQQVSKWPLNPVDVILVDLQKMNKGVVIADLGCGDAKIARVLSNRTVHSFDLVAKHECVTECDMSRVPLPDNNVDVAVFCLSLMGVNLVDYLREAYRILKIGGTLKIAEVESRIVNLDLFIASLSSLGFVLERKNTKNKLFVFLDLKKEKKGKASKVLPVTLRPCLYKKR